MIRFSSFLVIIFTGAFIYSCENSTLCCPHPGAEYSHTLSVGSSAHDFLAGIDFNSLVVEVDYMAGYQPNTEALNALKLFLQQRLNKSSITILDPTQISAGGQDTYTAEEIRNLEEENRDKFTQEQQIATYILIVDGNMLNRMCWA